MKLATNNHFFIVKEESIQDNKLATVGEREYKICLSDNLVLGSNQDFYYISAENPKLYSFKKINKTTFDSLTEEEDANQTLIAAFSRVLYSLGEFYDARDCLIRTNDRILVSRFKEATTTKEVIVAIDHLDAFILRRKPTIPFVKNPGQLPSCDLITLFTEMRKAKAMVDIVQLQKIYQRKSSTKKYGSLNDQGVFIPCPYITRSTTKEWAYLVNSEFTKNGEFNISLKENVVLHDTLLDIDIVDVAGITLNLQSYKSYNLYDKEGCRIKTLLVRVDNKYLDEFELKTGLNYDFFEEGTHTDHFMFEINIEDTPIIHDISYADPSDTNPKKLIALTIITDFLRGLLKESPVVPYTQEQLDALKAYHITPYMNFNPPSITDTKIDNPSIKVDFGSKELGVITSHFKSGNFYFDRRFSIDGVDKLSLPMLLTNLSPITEKTLSSKFKVDKAEELVLDVYKYLLGLSDTKGVLSEYIDDILKSAITQKNLTLLNNLQKEYDKQLDDLYSKCFIPVIIGKKLNDIDYSVSLNKDLDNSDYLIDIKA
jgi:hypothetical protein